MQRPAPYSYHLDDQPRIVPSVYAADLELARGAANTTSYVQSGFSGTVPRNKELETLKVNASSQLLQPPKSSRYANLTLCSNSIAEPDWDGSTWKYSFYTSLEAPFGKGAEALKPSPPTSNSTNVQPVEHYPVSAYFDP